MSEDSLNQLIYNKNVIEFITVANEYCNFVEDHTSFKAEEFMVKLQKIFPLLYLKASMLPPFELESYDPPEKFVSEVDYSFLLNKLVDKFGQHDTYQEVFDPNMQFSDAPLEASIAENICDVYQDTKDLIMGYQLGAEESMYDALADCTVNFKEYWGQKLLNGLRAIHQLVYSDVDWVDDNIDIYKEDSTPSKDNWVNKHFNNYSDEDS